MRRSVVKARRPATAVGVILFPQLAKNLLVALFVARIGVAASDVRADPAPWSWDLAVQLQPLRPALDKPAALAAPLRPMAAAYQKRQFAAVCKASGQRWQGLMLKASKLFYAAERSRADSEAIERFFDEHVRGERPLLALGAERFVPAATWRALALDACLRAHRGAEALVFAVGAPQEPVASLDVARAVALAARTESWAALDLPIGAESLRAVLLRALLAPEQAGTWLARAKEQVRQAEDRELVTAVATHLGRGAP